MHSNTFKFEHYVEYVWKKYYHVTKTGKMLKKLNS